MRAIAGIEQPQDVLVARCVAGDDTAWATLYTRYSRTMAQFLKHLGVSRDGLDDAVQEVFLQAFRSLESFRGDAAIKTWLYRLAVTQARRSREKARFWGRIRQVLALEARETSSVQPEAGEAERLLQRALGQLSALEREAFVLYELEGQSGVELSVIFGCPEPTVYRRLHEARKKFTAFVEQEAER
ncbi:MAG TPA: RNA polymerase sigma factor [Polyangiaceae bacterium]|nr:RNA polymerase sigma factor [Polyangiaceae bacterium]